MIPYYADESVTLHHGDCLELADWLSADVRLASARLAWYRLTGDERSLTVQRAVVDRLLDERITLTRAAHAAEIASVKR